ncbi:Trp biosynthesis-associated membrane protein, partial [Nocardioides pelophilus]|uniref:Trp biosynthesis-associated membrane protein n=1 Tax=Nocardioides pelophilus TaxID=2172019 RepID=UPI001604351D
RGRFRQVMAAVAALSAGGVFAVLVVGGFVQDDDAAAEIADQLGVPVLAERLPLDATPWFWVGLLASVVSVAAAVSAVWLAPAWPEMGNRYDAPSSRDKAPADDTPAEERTSLDLWKSMDEGEDPTDR